MFLKIILYNYLTFSEPFLDARGHCLVLSMYQFIPSHNSSMKKVLFVLSQFDIQEMEAQTSQGHTARGMH